MFEQEPDQRFHLWFEFRKSLETLPSPLESVVHFWDGAPRIPFNNLIDQHYSGNWPTPWEIIERNKYDDFTVSIMMGWTMLLTERFSKSDMEIRTIVDDQGKRVYNVLCVDNSWALNYKDHVVAAMDSIPSLYRVENVMPLKRPR